VCGKGEAHPNDLVYHIRTHTGEKPCICQELNKNGKQCKIAFAHPSALQRHIKNVHNKEKNHPCNWIFANGLREGEECGMSFGTKPGLVAHMQHHTGLYLHVCELFDDDGVLCKKGYTSENNLAYHVMTNHTDKESPEYLKFREHNNQYQQDRYENDLIYRMKKVARKGIRRVFENSGFVKLQVSEEITGCTAEEMIVHLNNNDRKYVYGDDDTFGKIVNDHVKPINAFDFSCYIELLKSSNWRNIQLLTETENAHKSDRFTPEDKAAYDGSWRGIEIEKEAVKWKAMGRCDCPLCVVCCGV